ncbi:MAG: undecaprenyldiphospho-muramoylpentapeptide beta-N-acetylglucosaminyltransferase [Nitrospinaceae bacterium]|nr:MAG: undecaprenyldiphospho-muramoylpentapeptide beta-N-acetylglucosaminyltransferase [Nitrospinaceae bacterium]
MGHRVVIAGGGTGGHLYPGIALARALQQTDMSIDITFIGTERGLEAKVIPREGFRLKTIAAAGLLGKSGLGRLSAWAKLPLGAMQALGFLLRKRPGLVVGVGGYVSGPVGVAAKLLGIPVLLHEQNALPGITNRLLGRFADKIAVSFPQSARFFPAGRVVETGNIIREEFCRPSPVATAGRFTVLVLGGSQGAHSINIAMTAALEHLAGVKDRLYVIHQTGDRDFESIQQQYREAGFRADVQPFIHDMATCYHAASLIITRAGATTLAEITACGKASVLIPFPHAAHNHQEKNARVLDTAGAAEVILDHEANGARFAEAIKNAMGDPIRLQQRAENSLRLGRPDATLKVRDLCLDLLGKPSGPEKNVPRGTETSGGLSCF